MSTWDEVREYVRGKYPLARDEPQWLGMDWSFDANGLLVTQKLKIELVTAFEEPWLLIRAAVCEEAYIEPLGALRYNAFVAIGALAVENGYCFLRATRPLQGLSMPELDQTVDFVAREAARLRQVDRSPNGIAVVFSGFTD